MPYKLEKSDDGYYVVNEDTDKRHSEMPMSKSRATRQMRALMAEGDKGKKKEKSIDNTVRNLLESKIHQSFTVASDEIFQRGYMTRDERINLSGLIGDLLEQFGNQLPPEVAERFVEATDVDWIASKENGDASLMVFKQADGSHRWITFSSNAFQDREKEFVSQAALDADVARADKEGAYGPLRWWHMGDPDPITKSPGPGVDIGTTDFNAMHGRILIESGTFKDEDIAAAVAKKSDGLGVSIGFFHPKDEPDGQGVFHNIHRFERSLLPKSRASNPFTSLLVTGQDTPALKETEMNEQKLDTLKGILDGDEEKFSKVLSWAEQTEKEADKAGVSFKEFWTGLFKRDEKPAPEETTTKEDEQEGDFVGDLSPAAFKELLTPALKELIDPLAADLATFKDSQAKFANAQDAIKEAVDNQSKSIKDIGERVKELEGETPRSAKGYRASQDDETVVKDDSTVKDAAPGIDPEFINHFLTRGGAPGA